MPKPIATNVKKSILQNNSKIVQNRESEMSHLYATLIVTLIYVMITWTPNNTCEMIRKTAQRKQTTQYNQTTLTLLPL